MCENRFLNIYNNNNPINNLLHFCFLRRIIAYPWGERVVGRKNLTYSTFGGEIEPLLGSMQIMFGPKRLEIT